MSVLVSCLLKEDKLTWTSRPIYDLQDGWIIQFLLPTQRRFSTSDEASDFAANILRPHVPWCFFGPDGHWSIDFDRLRKAAQHLAFPAWLSGSTSTIATVRPVSLKPPDLGTPYSPDSLEITCRFIPYTPEPTLEAVFESANRPPEIRDSLSKFRQQFAAPERVAFVIMRFDDTRLHHEIFEAIQKSLVDVGFTAVRADGRAFHDNLFENVLTYNHGCRFGVAVYDRLSTEEFNPNVALEVGYMMALRKPVCLLKDKTLRALNTDLMGRIYRAFDPQSPGETIPSQLKSWMDEKDLMSIK